MIEQIELHNFKSIVEDKIDFGQITVLVGANGSGKSNLVKALEFLSDIGNNGIALAINSQGGANGIIPKKYSQEDIQNTSVYLRYRCRMGAPKNYPEESQHRIFAEHSLKFKFPPGQVLHLEDERLTFHQVLSVAACLSESDSFKSLSPSNPAHPSQDSTLMMYREDGKTPVLKENPPATPETVPLYLRVLGLGFMEKDVTTSEQFLAAVPQMWSQLDGADDAVQKNRVYQRSFLDPAERTIMDFSILYNNFRDSVCEIRRYDLLLNELRYEQPPSDEVQLSEKGENMPSALRELAEDPKRKKGWRRLRRTFSSIAPHIANMHPEPLRTGDEFVEFVESKSGRGVESWESSDGSLRALAILLAIETASEADTILIEEPEQNLHPWAVRSVMDHIREAATELGLQIIITTHSQQVLERVTPDEVRVATRSATGGTKFRRVKDIIPHGDVRIGEVGELWVKGLLSGVPTGDDHNT